MIKLIDILNEGTIQLTSDERNQIEEMIPKIIEVIKNWKVDFSDGALKKEKVLIGTIDYQLADKSPGKVTVYVNNDDDYSKASGLFYKNDPKNLTDNVIVIRVGLFYGYFSPAYRSPFALARKGYEILTGDKNAGIEELRQVLKHELIHAKDPALNHYFLKEPYDSEREEIYYKSWAEFQTMTGQFFESITTGVDRIIDKGLDNEEVKKIEKVLNEILNFYAGKSKTLSQDVIDFIQDTGKRNVFQSLIKWAENELSSITRTRIRSSLDAYIAYINKIKQYNPEGYKEFLKDLYKTIDQAKDKVNKSLSSSKTSISPMALKENVEFNRMLLLAGLTKK